MIIFLQKSSFLFLFILSNLLVNAQNLKDSKQVENKPSVPQSSIGIKQQSASSIDANITSGISGKKHFIIHFYENNMDTMAYHKAAYYFPRFEQYRFYNKRRIINFVNKKASIELFSAIELNILYGKRINQQVIKEGAIYPEIEFDFSNNMLKEQFLK